MLTAKIKKAINAHASECYPRESCGVIIGKEYIPCTNIAADDAQFEICDRELVKVELLGKIKAYVHSHPDGNVLPSMPDRVQMNLPIVLSKKFNDDSLLNCSLPWVITNGSEMAIHEPDGYQAPLLGREYHHGLMDCYTLIKDYYQRELGVTLNDYERTDEWWTDAKSKPLYVDNFKNEGFVEVDTIQEHDLILCRLGRTEHINHALVFIGDGTLKSERTEDVIGDCLVLHHPYGRDSIREIYGDAWQRRAAMIIRHKSLIK